MKFALKIQHFYSTANTFYTFFLESLSFYVAYDIVKASIGGNISST